MENTMKFNKRDMATWMKYVPADGNKKTIEEYMILLEDNSFYEKMCVKIKDYCDRKYYNASKTGNESIATSTRAAIVKCLKNNSKIKFTNRTELAKASFKYLPVYPGTVDYKTSGGTRYHFIEEIELEIAHLVKYGFIKQCFGTYFLTEKVN